MRAVGLMRRQRELGIAGQLEPAGFARNVDQRNKPDLSVVFGGNRDLGKGIAWLSRPTEFRFVRSENPGVTQTPSLAR